MLFNSYEFIVLYLPIVLCGFFWIGSKNDRLAALWVASASLFFYGWWNPKYVPLLLASIVWNYAMGYAIGHALRPLHSKILLTVAVLANLALLGYFKYTNFFIDTVNRSTNLQLPLADIILPLGISFFTFTQIAFLVDVYRGYAREYSFIHYTLFVSYFPHLIAGPLLHHKQMMPQFALPSTYVLSLQNFGTGLMIFTIGLAKKVVLADSLATFVGPVFDAADRGQIITFFEAWGGALAYTFQLYFDFSGYSDMAIGISLMFGVTLPLNFYSPYKARNIIDFWRRWHMTLSQFLRDYLYIPLGGNRNGPFQRYRNLLITMLLGGLWHGASWTFVGWGGLHGVYLVINHAWQRGTARFRSSTTARSSDPKLTALVLTFIAVVAAWVVFRAHTLSGAGAVLAGMAGLNGFVLPAQIASLIPGADKLFTTVGNMQLLGNGTIMGVVEQTCLLLLSFAICWLCPATQFMSERLRLAAVFLSAGFVVQSVFFVRAPSEFLYFQF